MKKLIATEWLLAVVLAGLFAYAGVVKVMHPDVFLTDIENYQITPYPVSWAAAMFLPWLELWLAITLLCPAWRKTAAIWCGTLMAVFILAMLSAWTRGLDISCGCFGGSDVTANYPLTLLRDLLILAVTFGILWCHKKSKHSLTA